MFECSRFLPSSLRTAFSLLILPIIGIQFMFGIFPRLHFGLFHREAEDFRASAHRECKEVAALFEVLWATFFA